MKNSYRGAMQLCWKESSKNDLRYTQNLYIYVHLYLRNWSPLLSFSVGGCTCCFTIYIRVPLFPLATDCTIPYYCYHYTDTTTAVRTAVVQ